MSQGTFTNDKQSLRLIAEVVAGLENGELLPADLRALLERKPPGESSLDRKIVDTFEGYGFTEANFRETIVYSGQLLKRHRNGGGWVPADQDESDTSKPFVAETAYVGPNARVSGSARVFDNARVSGNARVFDNAWVFVAALVYDNARVFDNAFVSGKAQVYGNAFVSGKARVSGNTRVFDNAWVSGKAQVSGNARVYGKARVSGDADVSGTEFLS